MHLNGFELSDVTATCRSPFPPQRPVPLKPECPALPFPLHWKVGGLFTGAAALLCGSAFCLWEGGEQCIEDSPLPPFPSSRINLKRTDGPLSPVPTPQWCLAGEYALIRFIQNFHVTFIHFCVISSSFTWISALNFPDKTFDLLCVPKFTWQAGFSLAMRLRVGNSFFPLIHTPFKYLPSLNKVSRAFVVIVRPYFTVKALYFHRVKSFIKKHWEYGVGGRREVVYE